MRVPVSAIPKAEPRIVTHADMADNADIRSAIFSATPDAIAQTKEISKYFSRSSSRETCRAIFDYLKYDLNYVADGYTQIVRLPSALMRTKTGDCKSYSVFTSAILSNLGIPHHYRLVSYNNDPTPSHIYVATDDGCIIDAVWGTFDSEKTPTYTYNVKPNGKEMRVQTMTGIPAIGGYGCGCGGGCGCASCKGNMNGIGLLKIFKRDPDKKAAAQNRRQEKKDARKECGNQGAKPVTLALGRLIFTLMVQANLDGFATKMSSMDIGKIRQLWCKVGGNPMTIVNAIKAGSSRKSRRIGLLDRLAKAGGIKVSGIGSTGLNVTPAVEALIKKKLPAIAASTSALVGAASGQPAKGTAAGMSFLAVLQELWPMIIGLLKSLKPSDIGEPESGPIPPIGDDVFEEGFDEPVAPAPSGGGAAPSGGGAAPSGGGAAPSGGGAAPSGGAAAPKDDKPKSDNTMYIVLGVVAVGAFFMFKNK